MILATPKIRENPTAKEAYTAPIMAPLIKIIISMRFLSESSIAGC
jgi:hypothetical protein